MSKTVKKSPQRGRPQLYPLTTVQEKSIRTRLKRGLGVAAIAAELGLEKFAVLRIKRHESKEATA